MSFTEQEKAYHLRKMRTRVARLDVNKNGIISREDYVIMSERLSKYSNLSEEETKKVYEMFSKLADKANLKEGNEFKCSEYAVKLTEYLLSVTPDKATAIIDAGYGPLYEIIDTNNDGHISLKEFTIYLKVVAPDVTEDEAKHAFDVIDADKNGEISREEFLAAAKDFHFGVKETEISRVFWGKLLD